MGREIRRGGRRGVDLSAGTGQGRPRAATRSRRATILLMVVGLLSMLFVIVTAYLALSRVDRQTLLQARQANVTDQVVDSMNELIVSALRESWEDSRGLVLNGEGTYADMPGPGGSSVAASIEPVRDPLGPNKAVSTPGDYEIPATTAIGVSRPRVVAENVDDVMELDLATRFDTNVQRYGTKIRNLARNPGIDSGLVDAIPGVPDGSWLDADGDGIPDTRQSDVALLIEIANAIASEPVRVPTATNRNALIEMYNTVDPQVQEALVSTARRFYDTNRYDVAARVVPNGGKVSLFAPSTTAGRAAWNLQFSTLMFDWINKDNTTFDPLNDSAHQALLDDLAANASAGEALIARRGGALASWLAPGAALNQRAVVEPLRRLEGLFPRTMVSNFAAVGGLGGDWKPDDWQRFNAATIQIPGSPPPAGTPGGDEWRAYHYSGTLDALVYNNFTDPTTRNNNLFNQYDTRHLQTLLSYSDDVTRKQVRIDPSPTATTDPLLRGVEEGQLKFILGDITRPEAQGGAFDASGLFLGAPNDNNASTTADNGTVLVARLANYFYDMLNGYEGWALGAGTSTEAVSHRQQAFSLAVNLVAAAAPRDMGTGRIDTVVYVDTNPTSGALTTYIGYTPQPFLTQAIVHYDGGGSSSDVAIGVEIFNPNDDNPAGDFALDLTQFAISINDQYPGDPLTLRPFGGAGFLQTRLGGRSFGAFSIHRSNTEFTGNPNGTYLGAITDLDLTNVAADPTVEVKLWKLSATGAAYLVDQLEIEIPSTDVSGADPWYGETHRDTATETYWDVDSNGLAARWRMVMELPQSDASYGLFSSSDRGGAADPDEAALGVATTDTDFQPTIPLILMNSPIGTRPLLGTARPSSFPTTGFMFFVPRFSHRVDAVEAKPMGRVLYEQFEARSHTFADSDGDGRIDDVPADFGHMPLFDNEQAARGDSTPQTSDDSEFADARAGKIPWGLLVFDYFTTLNHRDPNGDNNVDDALDPRKIPGRLNINAAPWYLLAGVPILDPENETVLPLATTTPSFRDRAANMLIGMGADGRARFVGHDVSTAAGRTADTSLPFTFDPGRTGWYRLGPHLAQSAAAYRDRVQYVPNTDPGSTIYADAHLRNETGLPYRSEARYAEMRAGLTDVTDPTFWSNPRKMGFLSVGELLNVFGFDATSEDGGFASGTPSTVDEGDFVKGIALLAMLDSQYLTSRSNTFTVYVSVYDRENPQASVRSQMTVDRSNIVPQLLLDENDADGDGDRTEPLMVVARNPDGTPIQNAGVDVLVPAVIRDGGQPRTLSERRIGYFNARYDE